MRPKCPINLVKMAVILHFTHISIVRFYTFLTYKSKITKIVSLHNKIMDFTVVVTGDDSSTTSRTEYHTQFTFTLSLQPDTKTFLRRANIKDLCM